MTVTVVIAMRAMVAWQRFRESTSWQGRRRYNGDCDAATMGAKCASNLPVVGK
jgi:hypothetical protein